MKTRTTRISGGSSRTAGSDRPVLAETLEGRTLMSAALSANLGRFAGGVSTSAITPTASVPLLATTSSSTSSSGDTDDRIAGAKKKTLDFTESGDISYGFDVDMYKFTVKAGQVITFDIDLPTGSLLDSALRLFDASGREIASSDNDAAPDEALTFESYVTYAFTSANTYYIAVSGAGNDAYNAVSGRGDVVGSTGKYKLTAKKYVNPDNDDTFATAKPLPKPGIASNFYVSNSLDVDMFKFTVKAGQTITFDVDASTLSPLDPLDSYLQLFSSNSKVAIASNDDGDAPGETETGGQSFLTYTFTNAGTYYIAVSGTGNQAYDPVTGLGDTAGAIGHYNLVTTLS